MHGRKQTLGTHNAEDGIALALVLDGVVDDAVLFRRLLAPGVFHVRQAVLHVAHVDLGQAAVEEDFGGEELEFEPELLIVDELVSAQVEESGGKVVVRGIVALEEEVGDTALEVSVGKGRSVSRHPITEGEAEQRE